MISKQKLQEQAYRIRNNRIKSLQQRIETRMVNALAEYQKSIVIYRKEDSDSYTALSLGLISSDPYRMEPCLKNGNDGLVIYFDLDGEDDGN